MDRPLGIKMLFGLDLGNSPLSLTRFIQIFLILRLEVPWKSAEDHVGFPQAV